MQLIDKSAGSFTELDNTAQKFVGGLFRENSIAFANSSFSSKFPQYNLNLDVPKIKASGLSVDDVLTTMQSFVGGLFVSNFSRFGNNTGSLSNLFQKTGKMKVV